MLLCVCEALRLPEPWHCPVDGCVYSTTVKRARGNNSFVIITYDLWDKDGQLCLWSARTFTSDSRPFSAAIAEHDSGQKICGRGKIARVGGDGRSAASVAAQRPVAEVPANLTLNDVA